MSGTTLVPAAEVTETQNEAASGVMATACGFIQDVLLVFS